MAFFSIIIPTFNSSKTLPVALESLLCQSFKEFEILILDGLSLDNTVLVAKSFNDNRIKIFSEPDNGIYDAMNKGVKKASGEWLYFLGSDDLLNDFNVLNDVKKAIETQSANFIYGNVIMTKDNSIYDGYFDLEKLCIKRNICHQAIFYKRSLFGKIGYYNLNYKVWADWDLNIRCFSNPFIETLYINRIICIYNNQGGVSMIGDEKFGMLVAASYINKISNLESNIEQLKIYINNIHNSKTHRIGNSILMPYRFIKRLFKNK